MNKTGIEPNAIIADVVPTLSDPEEYVRLIVATMAPCYKEHKNARVRIGITGEGKMPYHKITFADRDGIETFYGAFGGFNQFRDVKIHESTWSTAFTTFEDVQALLGKLRGWKGKRG